MCEITEIVAKFMSGLFGIRFMMKGICIVHCIRWMGIAIFSVREVELFTYSAYMMYFRWNASRVYYFREN